MKIAVEGCCHGELDKIYETIEHVQQQDNVKIDLLLICGDFQAARNKSDLKCMAMPTCYQKMNTFYKYYSGEKKAPVLTVFIGGNHEASNYMQELPYGGWVAPNIYYMGYAGVVNVCGIRIGGISGIFKSYNYNRGHFEHPPYSRETVRSVYHTRNLEVFRLKQITSHIDIMLSHDWPRGVYHYGDVNALLRKKKFFREDIESDKLGCPATKELLHLLQPSHWFSAHLHVKFAALVEHKSVEDDSQRKVTKFLSLDKCLPKRQFLQVVDVPTVEDAKVQIELDQEWLAILKSTDHLLNLKTYPQYMPGPGSSERWNFTPTSAELKAIFDDFGGDFTLPENFKVTAVPYNPALPKAVVAPAKTTINDQTTLICKMLNITDPNTVFAEAEPPYTNTETTVLDSEGKEEICNDDTIDDEDDLYDNSDIVNSTALDSSTEASDLNSTTESSGINPDEISLDEEESDLDEGTTDRSTEQPIGDGVAIASNVCKVGADEQGGMGEQSEDVKKDVSEPVNTNQETGVTESKAPQPKKFKRRNQDIYKSVD